MHAVRRNQLGWQRDYIIVSAAFEHCSTAANSPSYLAPVLRQVGVTNPTQITGINGGLAGYNLVLALAAGLNVERIGRRPLFFAGFIGMFLSYCFVMGLSAGYANTGNSQMGVAVIPFLFFFESFQAYGSIEANDISMDSTISVSRPYLVSRPLETLSYSVLIGQDHYTTEILPYALRSKGLAIFTSVQNCANALSESYQASSKSWLTSDQFVNPIALAAITWR